MRNSNGLTRGERKQNVSVFNLAPEPFPLRGPRVWLGRPPPARTNGRRLLLQPLLIATELAPPFPPTQRPTPYLPMVKTLAACLLFLVLGTIQPVQLDALVGQYCPYCNTRYGHTRVPYMVRTMVPWYHGTYTCTNGTMVPGTYTYTMVF